MKNLLLRLAILMTLFTPGRSYPQSAEVERILVPIYLWTAVPGAFGAVWESELRILNRGAHPARIENFGLSCQLGPCPPDEFPPGVSVRGDRLRLDGSTPAAWLLVRKEYAQQFEFQLRVRDTSRGAQDWGTWLPLVREAQQSTTVIHLLQIPVEADYRHMLRVYSFNAHGGSTVRVRVFDTRRNATAVPAPPDQLLHEFRAAFTPGTGTTPPYIQVADFAGGLGPDQVRITVEPEGDFGIWAMVSITNNNTQHVTMIMPNGG